MMRQLLMACVGFDGENGVNLQSHWVRMKPMIPNFTGCSSATPAASGKGHSELSRSTFTVRSQVLISSARADQFLHFAYCQ